jgi:phosphotransferase system enzyme I (PtsI)/phosphotransferase system enzyme I (PtsP)
VRREYRRLAAEEKQLRGQLQGLRDKPALTPDGVAVSLYANSGLLADISPGLANGAEGLGLYRTEIPFMVSETFPSEDEQCHIYRQVLEAYRGKSVHMRVLDIGGDKPLPYFPIREENPALGWRGIRFCLDNISLLMTQLRAMLRAAAGIGNLRILVPMVANTAELSTFHLILADACSQLIEEGIDIVKPPVGIMVEVPAAISQLPLWRSQLDFISIGSNDLSQYLLALDRNNPRVSAAYDHIHPAVLREIARIVDSAEGLELPLSLCGEMSSDPAAVVLLIGMGIRSLSMSAAQLPRIKWLIRSIRAEEARSLARQALAMGDSDAIRALVNDKLRELGLSSLVH